jgi:phage terminase Nu1 subunit (DNA packaging protein)
LTKVVELSGVARLRLANKAQIAEFFDVSVTALDGWIRRGCPVVKRGGRSEPWVMDALEVAKWRFAGAADDEDSETEDPKNMLPQDRKAWYESEIKRRDLQERDRELIPSADAERVVAVAFAAISQDLRAIPDNLERRGGVTGEVAEQVEAEIYKAMDSLADRLSVLGVVEE